MEGSCYETTSKDCFLISHVFYIFFQKSLSFVIHETCGVPCFMQILLFECHQCANHFNLSQHTLENLQVMVLRRLNCNRRQRQIEEQKMIARWDTTASFNQDLGFLAHYFLIS